jgi:hypothetical protein
MIGPDDLEGFLASDPPDAILVGLEKDLDPYLIAYAKAHGYKEYQLSPGIQVWTAP